MSDLQRFVNAQQDSYGRALKEIRNGRKKTCWMWFIFPQIRGLGFSGMAVYYAIQDLQEARDYLQHEVLGARLGEICRAALEADSDDAFQVFGSPDDMKLRSSMTLFEAAAPENPLFGQVLDKYFGGERDSRTLAILAEQES